MAIERLRGLVGYNRPSPIARAMFDVVVVIAIVAVRNCNTKSHPRPALVAGWQGAGPHLIGSTRNWIIVIIFSHPLGCCCHEMYSRFGIVLSPLSADRNAACRYIYASHGICLKCKDVYITSTFRYINYRGFKWGENRPERESLNVRLL